MSYALGAPVQPDTTVSTRGMFIVFEGGEGAGKSSQITELAAWLRSLGRTVVTTHEPGGTPVGADLRAMLLHGKERLDPRCEALIFAADRAQHVASVVLPALARGDVIVCDRHVDSSLAYQGAGGAAHGGDGDIDQVRMLSAYAVAGVRPDLVILLDIDPRVGLARAARRGQNPDTMEARHLDFHDAVRQGFLDLAAADPVGHVVVDASQDPESVGRIVHEAVRANEPMVESNPVRRNVI